jgi:hypothetical protein
MRGHFLIIYLHNKMKTLSEHNKMKTLSEQFQNSIQKSIFLMVGLYSGCDGVVMSPAKSLSNRSDNARYR